MIENKKQNGRLADVDQILILKRFLLLVVLFLCYYAGGGADVTKSSTVFLVSVDAFQTSPRRSSTTTAMSTICPGDGHQQQQQRRVVLLLQPRQQQQTTFDHHVDPHSRHRRCWSIRATTSGSYELQETEELVVRGDDALVLGGLEDEKSDNNTYYFQPVLNFANQTTIDMVDRLDDAIMGGISTSTVILSSDNLLPRDNDNVTSSSSSNLTPPTNYYAKWVGVCRTDGGGFCGFRTNPFREALVVPNEALGLYIQCRLMSDNEPNRRIWKFTTRNNPGRGEVLYQAPILFPSIRSNGSSSYDNNQDNTDTQEWTWIRVPFTAFQLVRGPRSIPGASILNTSSGLYQIGMTMSKFVFGGNGTEIENFRAGFFELHIQQIGFYYHATTTISNTTTTTTTSIMEQRISSTTTTMDEASSSHDIVQSTFTDKIPHQMVVAIPSVMSKQEALQKQSLLFKLILIPLSRLFFTEESQRRKSVTKILTQRGMVSPVQRFLVFGLKRRIKSSGILRGSSTALSILIMDTIRVCLVYILKISFFLPVKVLSALRQLVKK